MNKALICVDVQPDFLPGGPLGVPDGDLVIHPLIDLMDKVDIIVLTRDWHPANHVSFSATPEFKDGSWPVHCVEHTEGAKYDDDLFDAAVESGKPVLFVNKGTDPNREAYSGFNGLIWSQIPVSPVAQFDLIDSTLQSAFTALSVTEVHIGGLALDYCVKDTALDAARIGYRTRLHLEATRPVAYQTGAEAIAYMAYMSNVAVS